MCCALCCACALCEVRVRCSVRCAVLVRCVRLSHPVLGHGGRRHTTSTGRRQKLNADTDFVNALPSQRRCQHRSQPERLDMRQNSPQRMTQLPLTDSTALSRLNCPSPCVCSAAVSTGANLNERDANGDTALLYIARAG